MPENQKKTKAGGGRPKEDRRPEADFRESENFALIERIEALEATMEAFKTHKHLGNDGSEGFQGDTEFRGRSLELSGGGPTGGLNVWEPLTITEGSSRNVRNQRGVSVGVAITGTKDTASEQVTVINGAGKVVPQEDVAEQVSAPNRTDWDVVNFARTRMIHVPQSAGGASGPSTFPFFAFLVADRSPSLDSSGTITLDGDTLVDSTADFETDSFAGSLINLISEGVLIESYRILSNTRNTIVIDGAWTSDSGAYSYQLATPVFLGSADTPFTRLYVGEDIRLGYGASGGDQVQYIKRGTGTPEGVVTANIGSMYLRRDGGANTTLYIKEAGDGLATGWAAI